MTESLIQSHTVTDPPGRNELSRQWLWTLPKAADERLSNHFSAHEFDCRCNRGLCHFTLISPRLLDALQSLRDLLAEPLRITSGYRCQPHNQEAGGSNRSHHTLGMAADVACMDSQAMAELYAVAAGIPVFGGIGRYPKQGFVHLDVRNRDGNGQPIEWSE